MWIKIGIILPAAWGLILAGCMANIPDRTMALKLSIAIFIIVLMLLFSAGVWVPPLMDGLQRMAEEQPEEDDGINETELERIAGQVKEKT